MKTSSQQASMVDRSIMIWGCFAVSGPLAIVEEKINSKVYQDILQDNLKVAVCKLKLRRSWMMQQDNDPNQQSKSTTEGFRRHKIHFLEWASQAQTSTQQIL